MNNEISSVAIELEISASPKKVWNIMVNRVSEWWPKDFMGLSESATMTLELKAGGRLYEADPNGAELLWGNVLQFIPGDSIDIVGHVTPQFGGPSMTMYRMALSGDSASTRFQLTNWVVGNFADGQSDVVTEGWNYLFGALKAFCEAEQGD